MQTKEKRFTRDEIETRIDAALKMINPAGDASGHMLEWYTRHTTVQNIPIDELCSLCAKIEKEALCLEILGEAKYFDTLTAGAKLQLYRAALATMETTLAEAGIGENAGLPWARFRTIWNGCVKDCEFPVQNSAEFATEKSAEKREEFEGKNAPKNGANSAAKKPHKPAAQKGKGPTKSETATVKTVTQYLNKKTGRNYRPNSDTTKRNILARLREGYTMDDLMQVVDDRQARWGNPPLDGSTDMRTFLRPETLFGNKFEGYLNDANMDRPSHREDLLQETYFNPIKRKNEGETA